MQINATDAEAKGLEKLFGIDIPVADRMLDGATFRMSFSKPVSATETLEIDLTIKPS